MPENVKCSVSSCAYWGSGNRCLAEAIMVEIDQHAGRNFHAEFGEIGPESQHRDLAHSSSATCCQTFKPKKQE